MGDANLIDITTGNTAKATDVQSNFEALKEDLLPRDIDGIVGDDTGSVGSNSTRWTKFWGKAVDILGNIVASGSISAGSVTVTGKITSGGSTVLTAQPGEFKWHMPVSGAKTIAQMQALGWAICNGDAPVLSGAAGNQQNVGSAITGAALAITQGETDDSNGVPDLVTDQRFIRAVGSYTGNNPAKQAESDISHVHNNDINEFSTDFGTDFQSLTKDGTNANDYDTDATGGAETRPINLDAVPLIYVLT